MKKLLTILLALTLAALLVACTEAPVVSETPDDEVADVLPEDSSDVEELPEGDDVVIELPEVDAGEEPAMGTEEDGVASVMPEVDVEMPAVTPEVEDVPAANPETTPEVEEPEVETPDVEVSDNKTADDELVVDVTIDDLYALADKLYEGIDPENMPMVGTMELNEENFEYSAFVPYKNSYLAVENMPMMGSMPHSVVIVKADSAEEAAALAAEMEANANPRKWICVRARSVKSASKGNFAILVMTSVEVMPMDGIDEEQAEIMSEKQSEERADIIISNFLAAVK